MKLSKKKLYEKRVLSLFIALALLFQPTVQIFGVSESTQSASRLRNENFMGLRYYQASTRSDFVSEFLPKNDMNIGAVEDSEFMPEATESELEEYEASFDDEEELVIIDEVDLSNVEIEKIADESIIIGNYILFNSDGVEIPLPRNQTAIVRERARIPNTNFDLTNIHPGFQIIQQGIPLLEASMDGGSTWHVAFCIEVGIVHPNNEILIQGNPLPIALRATVEYILLHGFGNIYGFSSAQQINDNAYIATQVLIWEAVAPQNSGHIRWNVNTAWSGNGSGPIWNALINGNAQRTAMYNQVRQDINDLHRLGKVPSFTGTNPNNRPLVTLTWDNANQRYQWSGTDNNGLLARFMPQTSLNVGPYTISRSGNTLTIHTQNVNASQTSLPASTFRLQPSNPLPVIYWEHPFLQNVVTGNFTDPLTAFLDVRIEPIGNLEVVKYSETNVRIPGTQFRVQGNGIDTVITTNSAGVASLHNIPIGHYTVTEVYVPLPYALADYPFEIIVSGNTNQVVTNRLTVTNELIQGSFELIKVSARRTDTADVPDELGVNEAANDEVDTKWLLPDVKFRLYFLNESAYPTYLKTAVTDSDGRIVVEDLLFGDYKLVESVTHYRHQLLSEPLFFSINEHRERHQFVVTNYQTQTQILKVNDLGEPLAGAHFLLLTYEYEELIHEWVSTNEPEILFALAHGDYILREIKAPEGFLIGDDIHFTVTNAEETIYIIADNVLNSRVYIATQAHTSDGSQYFRAGDIVTMYDNIEITHIKIRPNSPRAFRAFLFARFPNGEVAQVWYTDYIEYNVENVLEFNVNEPNISNFQVSTEVDTSLFPSGAEFFWAETAYRRVGVDENYVWREDYRHNFCGTDMRQTLFPRASASALPETGAARGNVAVWIGLVLIISGVTYAYYHSKKSKKMN